jgi:dipeptidyl aminopeptidase/acylaminoacyl peptidase
MPASKKRSITAEDLYRLELITDARISPDGRHVIMSVQRVDQKTEKKFSNLWLVSTERKPARQFTYGDHNDSSPRWSPDGSQIAFLSNRADEKQPQLYVISFAGGEARPLSQLKGTFGDFEWSPDGSQLLCNFRLKDKELIERESDEQKKKLGVVARHITETRYKFDGAGYLPKERWHIWTVNARSGKASQLTRGDIYHEQGPGWSSDGKQIVFVSNRSDDPDMQPDMDDLFVMPALGGELRRIDAPAGPKLSPSFSPDGRWIAYLGYEGPGKWWRNYSLWIVPSDGSARPRNLTEAADLHVFSFTSTDTGGGTLMSPTWSGDNHFIYFQVTRHGDTALMKVSVAETGIDPVVERVVESPGIVGPFTFDDRQRKLAYVLNDFRSPGQLFVRDMSNGRQRKLTRLNESWMRRIDLGQVKEVWFPADDGYKLQGWILTPPDFDPSQKYPSILEIHGGPQVQYGHGFMHEFYYLAAAGYVVYFSNPRGGQGYGEKHCAAISQRWGTVDFDDVMAWAAYISRQPYIDPARMGVTGGSYGGYMTNLIIGRSRMFTAAVTQRSVSNLVSMWGSSDGNWRFQRTLGDDLPPFENLEKYWDSSPLKYISEARTPTLVIHSEQDMRVAQEQGEQVFVALKKLGVDTELVLFPDEPHGLSRIGRTDRRIVRLNHIRRWFDKYLMVGA